MSSTPRAVLDHLTADIEDPAAVFACSFRLTGRFFRERPQESRILLANWSALMTSDRGLAPRAMRDIKAALAAGRFDIDDPELALTVAAGALMGLGHLLERQPHRDAGATADAVTESVLQLFGMSPEDARKVCALPLPDLDY